MSKWPNLSCNCSPFGECECEPEVEPGSTVHEVGCNCGFCKLGYTKAKVTPQPARENK